MAMMINKVKEIIQKGIEKWTNNDFVTFCKILGIPESEISKMPKITSLEVSNLKK